MLIIRNKHIPIAGFSAMNLLYLLRFLLRALPWSVASDWALYI